MKSFPNFMAAFLVSILVISQPVLAQSRPSPAANAAAAEDSLENQPINSSISMPGSKSAAPVAPTSTFDVTRVLLALIAVVALIFVLMAVFKRIYPGSAPIRASAAVKVLARCPVLCPATSAW